jgi:hypothetical protein
MVRVVMAKLPEDVYDIIETGTAVHAEVFTDAVTVGSDISYR